MKLNWNSSEFRSSGSSSLGPAAPSASLRLARAGRQLPACACNPCSGCSRRLEPANQTTPRHAGESAEPAGGADGGARRL